MEFAILGPLEVREDGQLVAVGGHKHQALLAILLLSANRVVSTDRLLEDLWGEDAEDKENALWVHVSRLRAALGDTDLIVTHDHGYSLEVDPADIDANRFESEVAAGRALMRDDPAAASRRLNGALAMWRGPPLADFTYEDFAQIEITRLNELQMLARMDRIEADLQLGRARELIGELEALHVAHPTRERVVALLMLALYRSGRQNEALEVSRRFRTAMVDDVGLEPSADLQRLEEQILLHDTRLDLPRHPTSTIDQLSASTSAVNPFKGLRPFREEDSAEFFGRDRIVAEVIGRLDAGAGLVGIIGPSGSGKSSIVRAGLIPALRDGAIDGSEHWAIAQMVPGARPFAELEAALLRSSPDAPDSLSEQLADRDIGVLRAALRVLPDESARLLLVIDQFEELFTLVSNEDDRAQFLAGLVDAIDHSRGQVTVVLTLRADFYGHPLQYPEFGSRLGDGIVNVVPLSSDELEMAAMRPAEGVGVRLEPALVAALLTDVIGRPGALPLFQYTLTELFDRRSGETLRLAEYHAMGGLAGALTRRAEELFARLDDEQRSAARQLFLRLVNIAENDEWTRRRVPASEILLLDVDLLALQTVIDLFSTHRLLVLDRDAVSGSPTAEVAHESLLTNWPRLRGWIEDAREDIKRHVILSVEIDEWHEADENPDYLLSGARLEAYTEWAATTTMPLTYGGRRFLDASNEHREQELADERERTRQGAKAARSARRRLWAIAAVAVAIAVGAVLVGTGVFEEPPGPTVAFFGYRGDGGWDDNIAAGIDRAAQQHDIVLVEASGIVDRPTDFRALAERGPDVIISSADPVLVAADVFADFPDIEFGIVDGFIDLPNVSGVLFENEQGAFLAGVAAAMTTETGVVGFVGGDPSVVGDFEAGFEAGAHWVDPQVEVLATYIVQQFVQETGGLPIFAWGRPDLGADRATALYERGADVVFHAAGASGQGIFPAAFDASRTDFRKKWAIGVDNDQWFQVDEIQRPHVLTSLIKRGDVAGELLVEMLIRDEPAGGAVHVGLADGVYRLSTRGGWLSDHTMATVERAETAIAEGRLVVPSEPTGEVLELDPIQNAFEDAMSVLTPEQVDEFLHSWIRDQYPMDAAASCAAAWPGNEASCLEVITAHLPEYLAEGRTP